MRKKHLMITLMSCLAFCLSIVTTPAWSAVVVSGSVVNGIVDPSAEGDDETKAFDRNGLTRFFINAEGGQGTRVSFVVDLEGTMEVSSVAMYGDPRYRDTIAMFSDEIIVEAGASATGPWTRIGSINVGSTRPTDPDPAIGGENPFTGGNGRLIPCTPTEAAYLQISGDQGFDNNILIYDMQINPQFAVHTQTPVMELTANQPNDFGDGFPFSGNSRTVSDITDNDLSTRAFFGLDVDLVLDLGRPTEVGKFWIHTSSNDTGNMVKTGSVSVSAADDPTDMDTLLVDFDASGVGGAPMGHADIPLPTPQTKRYFQLSFASNMGGQSGDGTNPTYRLSEIRYLRANQLPIETASVVAGSVTGGTVDPDTEELLESRAMDFDYATQMRVAQGAEDTMSFVVDLGGTQAVHSVGLYGNWTYLAAIMMLSGEITVEAGDSETGPWTQIGSLDVGGTRPDNPDPDVGGENPFTGGNGRRIICDPTNATHLRVSGGYGFDNVIDLYELIVNPATVVHRVDPVDGSSGSSGDLWDVGGNSLNSRVGAEAVDMNLVTRLNPRQPFAMTLDLGPSQVEIEEIRIFPMDSDQSLLPKTGTVRISPDDDPNNMTTVLTNFDKVFDGGAVVIPLTGKPTKRFLQVELLTNQGGSSTDMRLGEIQIIGTPTGALEPVNATRNWMIFE